MNLQEMYDYITANPKTIKVELLPSEDYGFYLFVRLTYSLDTYTADQSSICIIVKDRGLGTEEAFVKGTFPDYLKPAKTTPFKDELVPLIATYIVANPTFESYTFTNIDETKPLAEISAFVYDSQTQKSSVKKFVAFKINNVITFRELI
jgi:hypothetical protein